jgi:hypothetical protein
VLMRSGRFFLRSRQAREPQVQEPGEELVDGDVPSQQAAAGRAACNVAATRRRAPRAPERAWCVAAGALRIPLIPPLYSAAYGLRNGAGLVRDWLLAGLLGCWLAAAVGRWGVLAWGGRASWPAGMAGRQLG